MSMTFTVLVLMITLGFFFSFFSFFSFTNQVIAYSTVVSVSHLTQILIYFDLLWNKTFMNMFKHATTVDTFAKSTCIYSLI